MQPIAKPEYITIRAASEISGLSASYLRSWVACGKLSSVRGSRPILVDADCLAILLRARAARLRRPQLRLVVNNPHL